MKILIAEDNTTSRRILESILVKWNYEVISARDGNEAWEKLQEEDAPRLMILDWMMPGKNGVELCRKLRGRDNVEPMYIILLTARDDKNDIVEGLAPVPTITSQNRLTRMNSGRESMSAGAWSNCRTL